MVTKKIIVVEDDEYIRSDIVEILESEGYEVSSCKNGKEALTSVLENQAHTFDLIILDLNMPVMSGYEFAAKLREHKEYSNLPIVVVSAERDAYVKLEFPKITRYIKKPFEIDQLLSVVDESLYLESNFKTKKIF
jgi:CheY-like chemotaxis protein